MAVVLKEIYHWRLPSMYMVCMPILYCMYLSMMSQKLFLEVHVLYLSIFINCSKSLLKKLIFVHMYKFITCKY